MVAVVEEANLQAMARVSILVTLQPRKRALRYTGGGGGVLLASLGGPHLPLQQVVESVLAVVVLDPVARDDALLAAGSDSHTSITRPSSQSLQTTPLRSFHRTDARMPTLRSHQGCPHTRAERPERPRPCPAPRWTARRPDRAAGRPPRRHPAHPCEPSPQGRRLRLLGAFWHLWG
eukprot:6240888-Prymnesium_polylepis.1